jgi:lipopolysaccharide biosynthesis glycosyltransferase
MLTYGHTSHMKTALVLACDDNFIPFASVVARRVTRYAREKFPIVIVSDGVTEENKILAQKFCPEISFIEAGHILTGHAFGFRPPFSRACYLRLFFNEILAGFDRVAYIDCDVSPLTDVQPLLQMAPKAASFIAAQDLSVLMIDDFHTRLPLPPGSSYFNSGVMVMDLKAMQGEGIFASALKFAKEKPELCVYVDQDALNVAAAGRWQVLDWRWNAMGFLLDRINRPYFIRHITGNKPWSASKFDIERRFVDEWRSDLLESPWPHRFLENADSFSKTYVRPVLRDFERPFKRLLYANSPTMRGKMIRFEKRLPAILDSIESAASSGALARVL